MILSQPLGLVPPLGADAAGEHVEEEQGPRDLPPAEVAGGRRPPDVRRQGRTGGGDDPGELGDLRLGNLRFLCGVGEGVPGVVLGQCADERVEVVGGQFGVAVLHVGGPVHPATQEGPVDAVGAQQMRCDGQQDRGLAAGPRGDPQVGVRRGVRQPRIQDDDLGAALDLALHDPLRVRVEVVPGLEVARDQQDDPGVRVVRGGPVVAAPQGVAQPGAGGADVGVAVVPVHAPRQQEPLGEAVLAGPAHVVDDLVPAVLHDGGPDPGGDVVEGLVPADALPLPTAAGTDALERVQDALGVVDLVDRRGTFGAVAPA